VHPNDGLNCRERNCGGVKGEEREEEEKGDEEKRLTERKSEHMKEAYRQLDVSSRGVVSSGAWEFDAKSC